MFTSSNEGIILIDVPRSESLMKILPIIKRIVNPSQKVAEAVTIAKPAVSATAPKVEAETNPFLECIYEMYEKDGVPRDVVDRIVLGGERQRFYRYVGKDELQKLI